MAVVSLGMNKTIPRSASVDREIHVCYANVDRILTDYLEPSKTPITFPPKLEQITMSREDLEL